MPTSKTSLSMHAPPRFAIDGGGVSRLSAYEGEDCRSMVCWLFEPYHTCKRFPSFKILSVPSSVILSLLLAARQDIERCCRPDRYGGHHADFHPEGIFPPRHPIPYAPPLSSSETIPYSPNRGTSRRGTLPTFPAHLETIHDTDTLAGGWWWGGRALGRFGSAW